MKKKKIGYKIYKISAELKVVQLKLDMPISESVDLSTEIILRDIRAHIDLIQADLHDLMLEM